MAKPILKVEGLQETYAVLKRIRPELVKQTTKRMKTEARPIIAAIRREIPDAGTLRVAVTAADSGDD